MYKRQVPRKEVHLTEEEKELVLGNIRQNIISLAKEHQDVTFYYFFTPYSILWWQSLVEDGTVYKQVEAEELVIQEVLKTNNIKLFSFNNLIDIVTDINNYKDEAHYGAWINSLMLTYMKEGKCQLTKENYRQYIQEQLKFYTTYDYAQLNEQVDYEKDYYADALLNQEINGVLPIRVLDYSPQNMELCNAQIIDNQYNGALGLQCTGHLSREALSNTSVADHIMKNEYVGGKFFIEDIGQYKYLNFYGRKNQDNGQPGVYIYREPDELLYNLEINYQEIDNNWHQYLIDLSDLSGDVVIVFNGGYIDNTGAAQSMYTFSDITLY